MRNLFGDAVSPFFRNGFLLTAGVAFGDVVADQQEKVIKLLFKYVRFGFWMGRVLRLDAFVIRSLVLSIARGEV